MPCVGAMMSTRALQHDVELEALAECAHHAQQELGARARVVRSVTQALLHRRDRGGEIAFDLGDLAEGDDLGHVEDAGHHAHHDPVGVADGREVEGVGLRLQASLEVQREAVLRIDERSTRPVDVVVDAEERVIFGQLGEHVGQALSDDRGRLLERAHVLRVGRHEDVLRSARGGDADRGGGYQRAQVLALQVGFAPGVALGIEQAFPLALEPAPRRDVVDDDDVAFHRTVVGPTRHERDGNVARSAGPIRHVVLLRLEALAGEGSFHLRPELRVGAFTDDLRHGAAADLPTVQAEPSFVGFVHEHVAFVGADERDQQGQRVDDQLELGALRSRLAHEGLYAMPCLHLLGHLEAEDVDAVDVARGVPRRLIREVDVRVLEPTVAAVELYVVPAANVRNAGPVHLVEQVGETLRDDLRQGLGHGQPDQRPADTDEPLVRLVGEREHVSGPS